MNQDEKWRRLVVGNIKSNWYGLNNMNLVAAAKLRFESDLIFVKWDKLLWLDIQWTRQFYHHIVKSRKEYKTTKDEYLIFLQNYIEQ
jgi:hypothetical protein